MAVYERTWRRWGGVHTRLPWRFLVVTKFALNEAFASRAFTAFYAACALPTLVALFLVYLSHNVGLLEKIGLTSEIMSGLTNTFFAGLFPWQAIPAFFVAVIVSPSLIAPDLANNALPLYLSRPLDRRDYVAGKMAVLVLLLSPVTWLAGLAVFLLQAVLEGKGWWWANLRIGVAYVVGHWTWIVVISLLTLAISAWVRFKPVARGALFGLFFILGAVGQAVNGITGNLLGDLVNPTKCIVDIVIVLFDPARHDGPPVLASAASLAVVAVVSLWLLHRKLEAHEVVE